MNIQINNIDELLEFIKRPDVSKVDAMQIFKKTLNVIIIFESELDDKQKFINDAEKFIDEYCRNPDGVIPLFLLSFEDDWCKPKSNKSDTIKRMF